MKNIKGFIIIGMIIFFTNIGVFFLLERTQEQKFSTMITEAIKNHNTHKPHYKPHCDVNSLYRCEVCGCLIALGQEIIGKKEIKKRFIPYPPGITWFDKDGNIDNRPIVHGYYEDYIYTPAYCKVHAPKVKK